MCLIKYHAMKTYRMLK